MATSVNPYPDVSKWFLCIDLKLGVLCYVTFEMMIWIFLSWAALDNEYSFFHNYDLILFEEAIDDNWYFNMIFGQPEEEDYDYEYGLESNVDDSDGIDIEYRFQSITVNGILMLVTVASSEPLQSPEQPDNSPLTFLVHSDLRNPHPGGAISPPFS